MRKSLSFLLLCVAIAGAWYFLQNFQIDGWQNVHIQPRVSSTSPSAGVPRPPLTGPGQTIRIASFNIQTFGHAKLNKPQVIANLAEVVRRFDVIALQEIRCETDDLMPRFIDMVNSTGRHYDYVISQRIGRTSSTEQYCFVYDSDRIEVDRAAIYKVKDLDDQFQREPWAAPFRVRGPTPEEAFTFTLVDIHAEPRFARSEVDALADVYRAVRKDGRGEDDVILLGDLNMDSAHLGRLAQVPNLTWALSSIPTNTRGDKMYDNIVFDRVTTSEFTGRAGVFDLLREFNLTMEQALEVSDHMPIWAEFSVYEGGQPGRVAGTEPVGKAR